MNYTETTSVMRELHLNSFRPLHVSYNNVHLPFQSGETLSAVHQLTHSAISDNGSYKTSFKLYVSHRIVLMFQQFGGLACFAEYPPAREKSIQVTMEQKRNRCPCVAPQSKYRPGLANGCNLHLGGFDDFMLIIYADDSAYYGDK